MVHCTIQPYISICRQIIVTLIFHLHIKKFGRVAGTFLSIHFFRISQRWSGKQFFLKDITIKTTRLFCAPLIFSIFRFEHNRK